MTKEYSTGAAFNAPSATFWILQQPRLSGYGSVGGHDV